MLDTKESVVRSLLKENSDISMENDSLLTKIDSLSLTVDHLTELLRNLSTSKPEVNKSTSLHSTVAIHGGGSPEKNT